MSRAREGIVKMRWPGSARAAGSNEYKVREGGQHFKPERAAAHAAHDVLGPLGHHSRGCEAPSSHPPIVDGRRSGGLGD